VLNFDGSQAIGFLIDNVPAGIGYMLTFMADDGDGGEACSGTATVSVTAQQTESVDVTAQCTGAPYVPTGYGSLDVWATLPASASFSQAAFVVTGPGGLEAQNTVTVTGNGLHFTLNAIPAGTGQVLTLNATSSDGSVTCSASSTFNIIANQTSEAMLSPQCEQSGSAAGH
jgi:hypothetical protein